jgi:nitrous oxide reductase accessory protein NosL
MKHKVFLILAIGLCLLAAQAVFAQVHGDIQKYASCKYCGMDREKFAHSRVVIEYDDGSVVATCSIHCASVELATSIDKTPKAILLGDYGTKDLIDGEKAFWVIGGNKMGVMTRRAKWAFGTEEEAVKFVKTNGGTLTAFDEVMKAAYEDMYQDTKMIREKRKMAKKSMQEHKHQ